MSSRARWCVLAAVALLASAYVLPLWRVELIAPQYPEGLGMLIRVNRVEGIKPNDLNSINNLNHYIGMQTIESDAIPELTYMPWILAGLVVGGLVVAALGRRVPLYVWAGVLGVLLLAGLYDYWRWGYHYGHDLNQETAIIKVPGMTYQPPLIGSKKLLNFRATSWPASGGIAWSLAALLTAAAVADSLRARRRALAALLALGVAGCAGDTPRAVLLGEDLCAYCRMTVTDARFAAEVVTRTGKVEVFDSVECLAAYVRAAAPTDVRATWVTDAESREFVRADSAGYLLDGSLHAPMGRIVAFASPRAAEAARATLGGTTVSWAVVVSDRVDAQALVVGARGRFPTITAALAAAAPGETIRVQAGTYREPTLRVDVADLTIIGDGWPVIDGEQERELLVIAANNVTVRGVAFANTGVSHMTDRAAVRVVEASGCRIIGNRFRDALFAVYLQRADGCEVRDNDIASGGAGESANGNGIHLWHSPNTRVVNNRIRGQRDGIYFEFSKHAEAVGNVSEENSRYGLHFMFSDSCRYEGNDFRANRAGVAVMYSKGVRMIDNRFRDARGSAAYGLLLKDITDGELTGNQFSGSSTGLYLEGASRLEIRDNEFRDNGWAVRLMADALDNRFTENRFHGNAFDVATNSRTVRSTFDGNYWDAYRGYDLDKDGHGDVPFRPVRLFALVVERHPEALLLLRSPVTLVLDAAERVFPVLTPALADARPMMVARVSAPRAGQ